jgi:hypothetical protein
MTHFPSGLSLNLSIQRNYWSFASSRSASAIPREVLAATFPARIGAENGQKATPRMPRLVQLIHNPKDVGFANAGTEGL